MSDRTIDNVELQGPKSDEDKEKNKYYYNKISS